MQGGASPELLTALERLLDDLAAAQATGKPLTPPTAPQLLLFARSMCGVPGMQPADAPGAAFGMNGGSHGGINGSINGVLPPHAAGAAELAALAAAASGSLRCGPPVKLEPQHSLGQYLQRQQSLSQGLARQGSAHQGHLQNGARDVHAGSLRDQVDALVQLQGGASPELASSLQKVLTDLELFAGQGKPLHITAPTVLMIAKATAGGVPLATGNGSSGMPGLNGSSNAYAALVGAGGGHFPLAGAASHGAFPGLRNGAFPGHGTFPGPHGAPLPGFPPGLALFGGSMAPPAGEWANGLLALAQHGNGFRVQEGGMRLPEVQ